MNPDFTLLLSELHNLSEALPGSEKLTLRKGTDGLECQFLMGGLVLCLIQIRNRELCAALLRESVHGIIEGTLYTAFKGAFNKFALHVKARALYHALTLSQQPRQLYLPQNVLAA